jgi:EAL domain-containing protein (putative c-di-GMP-specific phosphodiesterase class I)
MELNVTFQNYSWYIEGALKNGQKLSVQIAQFPFRIGRAQDSNLYVDVPQVSRRHSEITLHDDTLWIQDLNSANGTYVNRKRVVEPSPLNCGDIIHISDAEFRLICRSTDAQDESEENQTLLNNNANAVTCEQEFFELIEKKEIVTFFQPIIKLDNSKTIGYEVLGRGLSKKLPTSPLDLFKIANRLGLEEKLSQLFREMGIATGGGFSNSPILFVNTHPSEIVTKDLVTSLVQMRYFSPNARIVLEIHEKAATDLNSLKKLKKILNQLKIGLAYDDFGVGQSRLNELTEVVPNFLKFDISLVRNIHQESEQKRQMIEKLVELAHSLKIATLAEGVESTEEKNYLTRAGFKFAQGFYFGKPQPFEVVKQKEQQHQDKTVAINEALLKRLRGEKK